tara:strand:+ start:100 stop:276 length:177 start_codon:yes stop_codon:yes gene_type:complete
MEKEVTNDAQLIQMLNKQLVEVLGQLREKEEECSELIELHIQKDEYIKDLKESKGTLI